MFGHEAAKFLDYVECFPNGGKDFFSMAKECRDIVTEGFPIWVIDGQVREAFLCCKYFLFITICNFALLVFCLVSQGFYITQFQKRLFLFYQVVYIPPSVVKRDS